ANNIGYNPTAPNAGNVAITGSAPVVFSNVTAVAINGQGGGDILTVTTPALADQVTLTPGAAIDAGTVTITGVQTPVSDPPLSYANLGAAGSLIFNDAGGPVDTLIYNGTAANDTFGVAANGDVTLNSQLLVHTPGVAALTLSGQDGDDTFNVPG